MRKIVVFSLVFLSGPALAAVLPLDPATRAGGAHGLAQGKPMPGTSIGGADGLKVSAPSAALGGTNPLAPSAPLAPLALSAAQAAAPAAYRGEWTADTRNTWRGDDGEPRVQFNLRTDAGDHRWGFGVRLRELTGFPSSALSSIATDVQFSWTREAGTFRFTGSFDEVPDSQGDP